MFGRLVLSGGLSGAYLSLVGSTGVLSESSMKEGKGSVLWRTGSKNCYYSSDLESNSQVLLVDWQEKLSVARNSCVKIASPPPAVATTSDPP